MTTLPMWPVWLIDVIGSALMIVLSLYAVKLMRGIYQANMDVPLYSYLYTQTLALAVFALSRSIGHIIKRILITADYPDLWTALSPISGSINSLTFVVFGISALRYANVRQMAERVDYLEDTRQEIRESHDFLQSIIDGVADPIMVIEKDYKVKLMNHAAKVISGENTSLPCHEISHNSPTPCSIKEHPCPMEIVRRTLKPAVVIHEHVDSDGRILYFEIMASPLFKEDGSFNGIIEASRDITERKRAEEELLRYSSDLEEANSLKDLFGDIISHDIMSPLQIIRIFMDEMKDETLSENALEYLGSMEDSLKKAVKLVESAALYSNLETMDDMDFEPLDINEVLLASVVQIKTVMAEEEPVIEFEPEGEHIFKGNPIIEQVFTNLLSNAVKYSPEDSRILIGVIDQGDFYKIYVKDWGYGIRDEDKEKLFSRFERLKKEGVKGTGLGLAIAKKVVDLHGGDIWVEDNPEGGSIFYVKLPKAPG